MASVKFDAQEARSLVKMGVYKTKPNPIISYKTTILPESSLRLSCLFAIQTCNVRRENGLFLSGKGKKKNLSSGSSSFQYWRECIRATRPPGEGTPPLTIFWVTHVFLSFCLKPYLFMLVWSKPHTTGFLSVSAFLARSEGGFRATLR